MAKGGNQKLKLLRLREIMLRETDEQHPLSAEQLTERLAAQGIEAERKAIYDDLDALCQCGVDVECRRGRGGGYYVGQRDFELAELKLLVDAVQASKFITSKKSMQLIRKIEMLASVHEAQLLQHQVYVANRIKTMNESILYNVDDINRAINTGVQMTFRYFEYTVEKKKQFRHDGRRYAISPYALAWNDENYYMVGYDSAADKIKHFRVDKMNGIQLTNSPREGKNKFDQFDMGIYSKKVFGMYGGEECTIRLRMPDRLVGVVIDWFGKDVPVIPCGDGRFETIVCVQVSPQFFGWLFGLGDACEILSPPGVRASYLEALSAVQKLHQDPPET